jgi:hypothetical protein
MWYNSLIKGRNTDSTMSTTEKEPTEEQVEKALKAWDNIPKHRDPSGRERMKAALKTILNEQPSALSSAG